jgi:16S rRNA (cytosine967-C5)-methyltransferase
VSALDGAGDVRGGWGARAAALDYLLDLGRSNQARRRALEDVDPRDRALFVELVAGATRMRITLDAVLQAFANAPLAKLHPAVREILRLGIYQLLYLRRLPPFAVVDESVRLVPRALGARSRGFVNAILRAVALKTQATPPARERSRRTLGVSDDEMIVFDRDVFPDPAREPRAWMAATYGFTLEAVEIIGKGVGAAKLEGVLAAANGRPRSTLRPRLGRAGARELIAALTAEGFAATATDSGLVALEGGDPARSAAFAAGLFAVQGSFAAQIAPLLDPRAGERILDLCAAPGGKSCHLAELAPAAAVTAVAVDDEGLEHIRESATRLGAANVQPLRREKSAVLPSGPWDAILLDVPCSNSGVLSRRPEARFAITHEALRSLGQVQRRLLRSAIDILQAQPSGGRIVYSTCSILAGEGRDLVAAILGERPRAALLREISQDPGDGAHDGGYAALIRVAPSS